MAKSQYSIEIIQLFHPLNFPRFNVLLVAPDFKKHISVIVWTTMRQ
jgi:hypothetical protein